MGWNATASRSDSDSSPRSLILESLIVYFQSCFGGVAVVGRSGDIGLGREREREVRIGLEKSEVGWSEGRGLGWRGTE